VTQPTPRLGGEEPRRSTLTVLLIVGAVVLGVVGVALGVAFSRDDNTRTAGPTAGVTAGPVSASPVFRPAQVGKPFDVGHWRITVTSMTCGTASELLAQNASNGQEPTDRVCVAAMTYTNIDTAPHLFGGTIDETAPESTQLGFAGEAAYTGHVWLQETVNPGLSQTNELIFKVPAGVTLDSVQIGEFLVKA
jgi:hypothetical protein